MGRHTMIRSVKDLHRCSVAARDGDIGKVDDLYFDDQRWVIRYLVVDARQLDRMRPVLISPMSVGSVKWAEGVITLSVTKEQVKKSPDIDTNKPVSRQREADYLHYYQYPYYWGGTGFWGAGLSPVVVAPIGPEIGGEREAVDEAEGQQSQAGDSHLRSTHEVIGYHIEATDGELGHIDDFLVDDESWAIRYAVVDTSNWWFGRKVVVDPTLIRDVNWSGRKVSVDISRQSLKKSTPFDSKVHLDHERDPQGWRVVDVDGRVIGRVDGVIADPSTLQMRYLDVGLESGGEHVLLPVEDAELKPADRVVTFTTGGRHG
jgi:sporulation protein YlmC with PRC-barrel domain